MGPDEALEQAHLLYMRGDMPAARTLVEGVLAGSPGNAAAEELLARIALAQCNAGLRRERVEAEIPPEERAPWAMYVYGLLAAVGSLVGLWLTVVGLLWGFTHGWDARLPGGAAASCAQLMHSLFSALGRSHSSFSSRTRAYDVVFAGVFCLGFSALLAHRACALYGLLRDTRR